MRLLKRLKAKLLRQKPIDHDELLRIYMHAAKEMKPAPQFATDVMGEIIGFRSKNEDEHMTPIRKGWYCASCRAWKSAILRETTVKGWPNYET